MSLAYSNPSQLNGILQLIEKELGFEYGYITNDPTRLKEWTADINLQHDEVLAFIFSQGGRWQPDDTNHDKYPIIEADLVSGKRDYTFNTDQQGNLVLDIFRVLVKGPDGVYRDINPRDQQIPDNANDHSIQFVDGQNLTGTPTEYDKTANGIFLNRIPNYSWRTANEGSKGLKVLINREGSYFTTSDTTKKPGVDGRIHELYVVGPAHKYASSKGLAVKNDLSDRKVDLLARLTDIYGKRERDVPRRMTPARSNCK